MNFEALTVEINKQEQDVYFTEIGRTLPHPVVESDSLRYRIRIRSNSYDFQSYARIEVWSTPQMSWKEVANIGTSLMQTPHQLCYRLAAPARADFAKDRAELLKRFTQVLS